MTGIGLLVVTLLSGILAAVMSVIAWRVARDERQRSEARVAALSAEIHGEEVLGARRLQPSAIEDLPLRAASSQSAASVTLHHEPFQQTARPQSPASRVGLVAAFGLFAFATLAAIAIWLSPGAPIAPAGPVAAASAVPVSNTAAAPLELLALGHERDGDRLNVHGVVRNPIAGGVTVDGLAAVVLVYDRAGNFVMSARAPLPAPALAPGTESRFQVAVPGAADVGRYRISFRTDDRIVPHVDKREPATLARVQ
jgi:hypothetical protein